MTYNLLFFLNWKASFYVRKNTMIHDTHLKKVVPSHQRRCSSTSQGSREGLQGRCRQGPWRLISSVAGGNNSENAAGRWSASFGGHFPFVFILCRRVCAVQANLKLLGSSNYSPASAFQTSNWESGICAIIPDRSGLFSLNLSLLCLLCLCSMPAASSQGSNQQFFCNSVCPSASPWSVALSVQKSARPNSQYSC